MSKPSGQDKSAEPEQSVQSGEHDKAEAAYYAKQAKDVSESRASVWAQTELAHTIESIKQERQNGATAKNDGEDYDYYNGLGQ